MGGHGFDSPRSHIIRRDLETGDSDDDVELLKRVKRLMDEGYKLRAAFDSLAMRIEAIWGVKMNVAGFPTKLLDLASVHLKRDGASLSFGCDLEKHGGVYDSVL